MQVQRSEAGATVVPVSYLNRELGLGGNEGYGRFPTTTAPLYPPNPGPRGVGGRGSQTVGRVSRIRVTCPRQHTGREQVCNDLHVHVLFTTGGRGGSQQAGDVRKRRRLGCGGVDLQPNGSGSQACVETNDNVAMQEIPSLQGRVPCVFDCFVSRNATGRVASTAGPRSSHAQPRQFRQLLDVSSHTRSIRASSRSPFHHPTPSASKPVRSDRIKRLGFDSTSTTNPLFQTL